MLCFMFRTFLVYCDLCSIGLFQIEKEIPASGVRSNGFEEHRLAGLDLDGPPDGKIGFHGHAGLVHPDKFVGHGIRIFARNSAPGLRKDTGPRICRGHFGDLIAGSGGRLFHGTDDQSVPQEFIGDDADIADIADRFLRFIFNRIDRVLAAEAAEKKARGGTKKKFSVHEENFLSRLMMSV